MGSILHAIEEAIVTGLVERISQPLKDELRNTAMKLSEQLAELRAEQGRLSGAVTAAAERIGASLSALEARIASLGEPDPDIQADIDSLRAEVNRIEQLGAAAAVTPVPEPPVIEPAVEGEETQPEPVVITPAVEPATETEAGETEEELAGEEGGATEEVDAEIDAEDASVAENVGTADPDEEA
jgi:hypothetical protein